MQTLSNAKLIIFNHFDTLKELESDVHKVEFGGQSLYGGV